MGLDVLGEYQPRLGGIHSLPGDVAIEPQDIFNAAAIVLRGSSKDRYIVNKWEANVEREEGGACIGNDIRGIIPLLLSVEAFTPFYPVSPRAGLVAR